MLIEYLTYNKLRSYFYNIKYRVLMRNKNRVKQTAWGASTGVLLLLGLLSYTARSGRFFIC